MTAMLDSTEADYTELVEGINSFVKRVVVPLEDANRELLERAPGLPRTRRRSRQPHWRAYRLQ